MIRGAVIIAGVKGAYSGKPRPWVVIQNALFLDEPSSITACPVSTTDRATEFRVALPTDPANGLREPSVVLVDKLLTLRVDAVDDEIGAVDANSMTRIDQALRLWLDL